MHWHRPSRKKFMSSQSQKSGKPISPFLSDRVTFTESKMLVFFMSDCAEQYFNAWSVVFGCSNTKKLLCVWHVDRAWRRALNYHVSEKLDKGEIYHHLRVLLLEREQSEFMIQLQKLMSYLLDKHPEYHQYFNSQYVPNIGSGKLVSELVL